MNGRPWEPSEDACVKQHYRSLTAVQIGKMLGRSRLSVHQRARVLEVHERQHFLSNEYLVAIIREKHAIGWTDSEIARSTDPKTDRHRVSALRKEMGLCANVHSQGQRQKIGAKTREQLQQAGLKNLCDIRLVQWKQWKARFGWPCSLTIRATQAIETFYRLKIPITRIQLCAAMGIVPRKRTDPSSNAKGGTVLAELRGLNLIDRLPKVFGGRSVYFLNPGVKPDDSRTEPTYESAIEYVAGQLVVEVPAGFSRVATNAARGACQLDQS